MEKFIVMIEGKNCSIDFPIKKNWFNHFLKQKVSRKKSGFFATRCVSSETASDAEKSVLEAVKRELETQWGLEDQASDLPIFSVSKTRRVVASDDPGLTAQGFSFYADDSNK